MEQGKFFYFSYHQSLDPQNIGVSGDIIHKENGTIHSWVTLLTKANKISIKKAKNSSVNGKIYEINYTEWLTVLERISNSYKVAFRVVHGDKNLYECLILIS